MPDPKNEIPIYLAAVGPKNCELAGEIADGWLGVFASPDYLGEQIEAIHRGQDRAADQTSGTDVVPPWERTGFEIDVTVPVCTGEDLQRSAATIAPYAALYVGGMGSREHNFYNALATRMGYGEQARRVQDLYLDQQWREAAAAVPAEFIDDTSLLGPVDRLADRITRYAQAGVTTVTLAPWGPSLQDRLNSLEAAVEAADRAGVLR